MAGNILSEEALLSFVQDAEGRAWSKPLRGWTANSGISVCNWDGVTCDDDDAVKEVILPSKGLSGTIPSELGLLTELEVLNLNNNMLQGSIPQEIANLKKLQTLDLTECFLTGTLPQRFESPTLDLILLANNAISGRFFQEDDSPHLQSIKEIRMENNLLTGTLHGPSMRMIPHLETLSLSDNDLSGLIPGEHLGMLPNLHYVYLDSNHFVGPLPSQLAQAGKASILELWVQDNALSGTVPASYVRFDKLHDFFIDGNKLTGALPPDLCGPEINSDFYANVPPEAERNYCDSIACPAGSVALEGVFPCEKCPGGESARLKNRYLGQTGECYNYTPRDILRIFHKTTTKGGAWKGVSDWDDATKNVCDMTGVACDAHEHIVGISLRNRGLEGHIPDEIGHLSFLESFDVSDNALMGYVPSDLQWTSITRFDISGNKIRGMVPPLLCMKEELNGNGQENVFYCDRIACPEGTFNSFGFHHGAHGETCQPCYDKTPFIAQKTCAHQERPSPNSNWKDKVPQLAKDASEEMGVSPQTALVIILMVGLIAMIICYLVRQLCFNPRKKYDGGLMNEREAWKEREARLEAASSNRNVDKEYSYNDEEEEEDDDAVNYTFGGDDYSQHGQRYKEKEYRDFIIDDEENNVEEDYASNSFYDDHDDDNMSRATAHSTRSATDFMNDHQGLALNRREKLKKAVSGRVSSGDLARCAREAASSINIGARRMVRRKSTDRMKALTPGRYYEDGEENLELTPNSSGGEVSTENNAQRKKQVQASDMLDVPVIT